MFLFDWTGMHTEDMMAVISTACIAFCVIFSVVLGIVLWRYHHLRKKLRTTEESLRSAEENLWHAHMEKNNAQHIYEEKIRLLSTTREHMEKTMEGICATAFLSHQKSFIGLVDPLITRMQEHNKIHREKHEESLKKITAPLEKNLESLQNHVHDLEKKRVGAQESLKEYLLHLAQGQKALSTETNALVTALRTPHIRGCWGEMQLRRVVELSGMTAYCDFQEQQTFHHETEKVRPDLCIRLTEKKYVLVDAKAPILNYIEASSASTTEEYKKKMQDHARLLKNHITALSKKKYWSYAPESVDFTVLFLPGEAFLSSALEMDASLLEYASQEKIILATPMILIALLKTIASGWKQEELSQQTHAIISTAKELYHAIEKMCHHMGTLGKYISHTSQAYHTLSTMVDHKILPTAYKLHHMPTDKNISEISEAVTEDNDNVHVLFQENKT